MFIENDVYMASHVLQIISSRELIGWWGFVEEIQLQSPIEYDHLGSWM